MRILVLARPSIGRAPVVFRESAFNGRNTGRPATDASKNMRHMKGFYVR
jgi:hypothetical protein